MADKSVSLPFPDQRLNPNARIHRMAKGFATGGVIMSEVSRYGRVFGERHPVAKLSDEDVGRIRALNARGVSYADLAEAFGLSVSAVGKICRFERRYVITAKWRDCDADG